MSQQTKVSLRPLGDRLIVQKLEQEDTLKGGIILPDTAKKKKEMANSHSYRQRKNYNRRKSFTHACKSGRPHFNG